MNYHFINREGNNAIEVDREDNNNNNDVVDVNGNVTGEDELTKAYLANPYKLNDRNAKSKYLALSKLYELFFYKYCIFFTLCYIIF